MIPKIAHVQEVINADGLYVDGIVDVVLDMLGVPPDVPSGGPEDSPRDEFVTRFFDLYHEQEKPDFQGYVDGVRQALKDYNTPPALSA